MDRLVYASIAGYNSSSCGLDLRLKYPRAYSERVLQGHSHLFILTSLHSVPLVYAMK
jgi:hypothetical protein